MQTPKIMMISHLDIEFMSYTTFPQCRINNTKTLVKNIETVTIVFCWNNCSGYSQEKCFKCNLVFPKLSRLKKGQRVKGF